MERPSKTVAAGLAGLGLGYALWRGWEAALDGTWRRAFGSPDLGAVNFATLTRRKSPNDALACPQDFCPEALPDFQPPVFPVSAARLRTIVSKAALSERGVALLHSDATQDRYLARTRLLRYPDTIVVQAIEQGEGRSTLALYSRSQVGRSDFGVNRRRLERWVARIGMLAGRDCHRRSP